MKKVIIGLVAIGGIIALRSAAGRSGHTMREHCKEKMASHGRGGEEAATPQRSEPETPQFVANGAAVEA